MNIKTILKEMKKNDFNLNFNFNESNWELTVFNNKKEVVFYKNHLFLSSIIEEYFREKIYLENEFVFEENEDIGIKLNFDKEKKKNNFLEIRIKNREFNFKIKTILELVKKIKNIEKIIQIEKENCAYWDYEEEHPYESRGLQISDFIDIRRI